MALDRLPRSRDDDFAPALVAARRALAERAAGCELPGIGGRPTEPAQARGNIEGLIGFVQVPLGLAGPLSVATSAGPREVYVPMATNEGAMVASYTRGMRLLAAGGGARSRVVREGLTQNPILVYDGLEAALAAREHVERSFARFVELVAATTRHGRLVGSTARVAGNRLLLEFVFTTGDAIGINMAARAAELLSLEIAERTGARERYVHGQDVEKRANSRALFAGRGRSVVAEACVPRAALAELARVTPEQLVAIWASYAVGYAQLGTHNWLVQSANGLAAVLVACGQDVAYLPECSSGQLDFQLTPQGDLYASASLPNLLVGTVGGGSGKGTARECLAILGCAGAGHANTFAEILGATVLAGDLSLMASFCAGDFVAAHERLGRNRPAEHGS
ncbi:MAG: 3-hydroxy-3-methylglutaryl-CoA reductase [Planctomycetes bacterium]|nr:3-hydroxy-3-methylglutaryl-CoA reductase [Planctomycetota bacterium]